MTTLEELRNAAQLHRTRDARLDMNYLSRGMKPKWTMLRVDGTYYDRKGLANWLLTRGTFSPLTRRPLNRAEVEKIRDGSPHRIFGLAPVLEKNVVRR